MKDFQKKWKTRHELPPYRKLRYQFDIQRLREDLQQFEIQNSWDGLGAEYGNLCERFGQLPPFFLKEGELPDEKASYQQLALSEFDQQFSLDKRSQKSGWFWDHTSPQRDKYADERFYRKPVEGIPRYLSEVLNTFRPYLHRARFAKLEPFSQVLPHVDYDTKYSVRLHIPIITSEECKVGINYNDQKLEIHLPADGSIYFLNQGYQHWATNPTETPRTHLILSVDTQKFLDEEE